MTVKKLSASTLTEVLIAMVIIVTVFTVAIGIFTKVTNSGMSLSRAKTSAGIQRIIYQTNADAETGDSVLVIDSVVYKRTISDYQGYGDLMQVSVQAYQQDKLLSEASRLIRRRQQ